MSDLWKRCEGEFVDKQFPLLQFLANTNHSAVFLTTVVELQPRKAAIKFVSADIPEPDQQLEIWRQTAKLNHPHLLRIFHSGRCRMAGMNLLYIVTELADEVLSQFLIQRALTAEEAQGLLEPLAEVMGYLHGQGLAHGHIKPSNLCAIEDQLKLSSDTIMPKGYSRESHRDLDVYDAPENSASPLVTTTLPADIWSLGVTLVETVTKQTPALPFDDAAEIVVAETIPMPLLGIAREALIREPARRWTIAEIAAQLNPAPLAAAATASASASASTAGVTLIGTTASAVAPTSAPVSAEVTEMPMAGVAAAPMISPLSVPLGHEREVPLAKLPNAVGIPPRRTTQPSEPGRPETTINLPSYVIPLGVLGVLAIGVALTLPGFFRRVMHAAVATGSRAVPVATKQNGGDASGSVATKTGTKAIADSPAKTVIEPKQNAENVTAAKSATAPASDTTAAPVTSANFANSAKNVVVTKSSSDSPEHGEVLEQVLPQAPAKALATIQGTVRVVVLVQVDSAGNVSSAQLETPSSSKYFADRALQAAKQWQFASPVEGGHSLPSQWVIRFEFTQAGAKAFSAQRLP
jgi:TonB family protein